MLFNFSSAFLKREADADFLESMKKPPSSDSLSDVVSTKPPGAAPITPTHTIGPSSAFETSSNSPDQGSTTGESVGATVVTNSTGASTDYDKDNDTESGTDESDPLVSDKEVASHASNQVESAEKFAASAVRQVTRAVESSNDLTPQSAKELFKTTPADLAEKRRQGPSFPPSVEDADESQGGVQTETGSSSTADGASTDEPLRSDKAPSQQFGSRTETPFVECDSTNNSSAASVTKHSDLSFSQAKSPMECSVGPNDGALASSSTQNSAFASPPTQDTASESMLETDSIHEGKASMASAPAQLDRDAAHEAFVASLAGRYVKPDDLWAEVFNKMEACKLTWIPGTGLADYEYVIPGMSSSKKGGIQGYDYFESIFGLQQLAFNRCGWKGNTAFLAEKARLEKSTYSSRERSSPRQRSTVDVKPLALEKSKPKRVCRKQSAVQEPGLNLNAPKRSSLEHAIAPAAKRQKETSGKAKREPESQGNRPQKRSSHTSSKNKSAETASVQMSTKRQRRNAPPKKPGKVREELGCCQRYLQQNKKPKTLAIVDIIAKPSKFKDQVRQVQSFLRNVIKNRKASDKDTEKPILYVCGAPGVGKTSAVEWCCQQATGIQFAFVNAASTNDTKVVLQEIKEALDIPGQQLTVTSFKKHLKKNTEGLVVLVIDEVDHMMSARSNDGRKMTAKEKLLNEFCTLASDPENGFALIGIANSVAASTVKKLKSLGMVRCILCSCGIHNVSIVRSSPILDRAIRTFPLHRIRKKTSLNSLLIVLGGRQ